MSNGMETWKALEVKIRPFNNPNNQERPDQKGASRVHLCNETLRELRLEAGQLCYLWKVGDTPEQRREAIVWPALEKNLNKKVVQVSKTFQEATGFKLADDLEICAAENKNIQVAETIVLRDVTAETELTEEDRPHWEWFLKESLGRVPGRAEVIFAGMSFKNVSLRGPKRTFVVDFVNRNPTGLGAFDNNSSSVKISSLVDAFHSPQTNGPPPKLEVANVAGIDQALKTLNNFLYEFNLGFKYKWARRSCAALIHGSHGTGKTFILDQVINTGWAKYVMRIKSDAKADTIRSIFENAKRNQPSIIVVDELEDLVGKDDAVTKKTVEALEEELDTLSKSHTRRSLPKVLVIAATLDIANIPLSLRRKGRFRKDIPLPIPDAAARKAILKSLAPPVHPDSRDVILDRLGDRTHAYTPEDLENLLTEACIIAENKLQPSDYEIDDGDYYLAENDLEQALLEVRPTAMHDINLQPPKVRWDEIGGQDDVKKALRLAVEAPLIHPERIKRIGISPTKGILLYGPPGCSKTLSAQAMATEIGFNFFAVKGAELLNMYVGESERAVRNIFARARAAIPSIIFFDEIESIGSKRESGRNNGVNVLTTLLNEMDGIETLKGVTVLAATNQPQALDLALLRPGRFDKLLYVAQPDRAGREEILRIKKRKMDFANDVDILKLADLTDGYSGAELVGICKAAGDIVLQKCEETGEELQIHMEDFLNAIKEVKKQITPELVWGYERWASGIKGIL